jgi:hypothetical protein
LNQNYSGISSKSNLNQSNTSIVSSVANTSLETETIDKSSTAEVDSSNIESAMDQELLFRRSETYSSLTDGITVLTKSPKKRGPSTREPKPKVANPVKTAKCSAHLATDEPVVKIAKARKPRPSRAKLSKPIVVETDEEVEKVEAVVKPVITKGVKRKSPTENVEPITTVREVRNKREASKRAKLNISNMANLILINQDED